MKSVVLSTTEAKYKALSEVVKEFKFIVQLLQTMNVEVVLPITVHVDKVGAIWLSNNRTTSGRTKHIDIRTSFVKEYQENGKIIIKFVKSEDNVADILQRIKQILFSKITKRSYSGIRVKLTRKDVKHSPKMRSQQEGC